MTTETPILNEHNTQEYPPMHTAEHILNATMVKMFGCPRSKNAHIERKKSKCDYMLANEPSAEHVCAIENKVNEVNEVKNEVLANQNNVVSNQTKLEQERKEKDSKK